MAALRELHINRFPAKIYPDGPDGDMLAVPSFTVAAFPRRLDILELCNTAISVEFLQALAGGCDSGARMSGGRHGMLRSNAHPLPVHTGVSVGRLVFTRVQPARWPANAIDELFGGPYSQALRELHVSEMAVEDCVWSAPARVTALTLDSPRMRQEWVTPDLAARIINGCTGLRRLAIMHTYLPNTDVIDEEFLTVESLAEVYVAGDMSCRMLERAAGLTSLHLSERHDYYDFDALPSSLASLRVDFCSQLADSWGGVEVLELSRLTSLTSLHLADLDGVPDGLEHLAALKCLELPRFKLYSHSPVPQFVPLMAGITRLSMAYPALDVLPRDLGPLTNLVTLQDLDVSGWDLSDADALSPLTALQPLTRLVVSGCRLQQPPSLSVATSLRHLCSLDLSCNPGFNPGFFFSNLATTCLTFLDFSFCTLTSPPPRLQCVTSLRELVLTGNTRITAPMLADLHRPSLTITL